LEGPRPEYLKPYAHARLLEAVACIEGSLNDEDLPLKWAGQIDPGERLTVIHSAGSVDLFQGEAVEKKVYRTNYLGTFNLLHSLNRYALKFCFVSTAFSSGLREGLIGNSFLNLKREPFRNPYERIKARVENDLDDYCRHRNLPLQILRPSIVCGRLMDPELFYTSKYDVVYGWAKYFWHLAKVQPSGSVRILARPGGGINVVPVDYVAKAILRASGQDLREVNIVHSRCLPHPFSIGTIMQAVGFPNFELVSSLPAGQNKLEKHYYRIVNQAFGPYMTCPPAEFDAATVARVMAGIPEPDVSGNFRALIEYAARQQFAEPAAAPAEPAQAEAAGTPA
jgi:nucleoside-diphosphate-sugar epimerase